MKAPAQKLRILHVSEVHWGGVVTLLRHFTAQQAMAGHEVHVLAPDGMPELPGTACHRWRLDRHHPWTVATALVDLERTVAAVRPDVVHLHSFVAGFVGRVPLARSLASQGVPVVYQPHAWSFELFRSAVASGLVRRWERLAARRTDVLAANCQDEVEEGRRFGAQTPAAVLGVAVDTERFRPADSTDRADIRRRLGIEHDHVLLCLGRVARQKGQDLLLPAWERHHPPRTALVLLGPGDTEPLQELAPTQWGKSVLAVGEHDDVRPWLHASDALVLCSRYETVGLVVAEAMACAVPVVTTAVNGARATVTDPPLPSAGEVVPLGDMGALVAAAARRVADPRLQAVEGRAGRVRAEHMFRPEVVAGRLEAAYRDAIATRTRKVVPT